MKKLFKFLIGLILVFGTLIIFSALLAKPASNHPFFDPDDEMLVIAHQGGNNLWPDNTLFAYQNAWELGVDVLEMDVHNTGDDVLVLIHDDTVDRTTDGSGRVLDYSFQGLQALDAAYHWTADDGATYPYRGQGITIPALEEVLTTFPDARMNIEIKQSEPPITASLCALIRGHGMAEQVLIASFDQETIRAFREDCPEVATTASQSEVILLYGLSLVYLDRLYSPAAHAVQVPEYRGGIHVLIPRFVKAAQGRNMDIHVWTVNEVEQMERMLDLGLGGIITDNPDRLLDLLGR